MFLKNMPLLGMTRLFLVYLFVVPVLAGSPSLSHLAKGTLQLADGQIIPVSLALSKQEKGKGLSGIKADQFGEKEGLLFYYLESKGRTFWMPNTYFNLDIFFVDENWIVHDIVRDLTHHSGFSSLSTIPTTPRIEAHYVLEMKATSPVSQQIKKGDQLEFKTSLSPRELAEKVTQ